MKRISTRWKCPKTMQPEGVDLEKAGRAAEKSFSGRQPRNYMARKIDMQRKQFDWYFSRPARLQK
jgi:hypothetical protein